MAMVPLTFTGGAANANFTSAAENDQVLNFNPAVTLGSGSSTETSSGSPTASPTTAQTPTLSINPTPTATTANSTLSSSTIEWLFILGAGLLVVMMIGGKRWMCFGGSSSSNSTSTAANSTTVNVTSNTTLDTSDLANAITALAGSQSQNDELDAFTQVYDTQLQAQAQVQSAEIAAQASSGISTTTIVYIVIGLLGLAFTAGFVKLPRGLRA